MSEFFISQLKKLVENACREVWNLGAENEALRSERNELLEKIEQLTNALIPFARIGSDINPFMQDTDFFNHRHLVEDYRTASHAVNGGRNG